MVPRSVRFKRRRPRMSEVIVTSTTSPHQLRTTEKTAEVAIMTWKQGTPMHVARAGRGRAT